MKDIFTPEVTSEIISRIEQLTPNSKAHWGRMNVAQMLAHCSVTYEFVYESIHPKPNFLMTFILKLIVKPFVVNEVPFRKNLKTAPAFIIVGDKELEKEKERLVAYVERALKDVFSTMLSTEISLKECITIIGGESARSPLSQCDGPLVIGNVGFVGAVSGMVYTAMTEPLARRIAMTMLGMSEEELVEEYDLVNDVIGELTNMSSGAFKNQLCDRGFQCRLSIPSIIRGKYLVVEASAAEFRQIYVFSHGDDLLTFELLMKNDDTDDGHL